MLTDPKLRSQVDALWDKFWTGGLTNPLDAIEQFSYSSHRPEGFAERPEGLGEGWSHVGGTFGAVDLRDVLAGNHAISR